MRSFSPVPVRLSIASLNLFLKDKTSKLRDLSVGTCGLLIILTNRIFGSLPDTEPGRFSK